MPSAGYNILKPSGQDKYDWVGEFKRPPPKRLILLDKEKEIVFSETRIEGIGFHLAYTVYSKLVASHAYQASRKVERMYLTCIYFGK